MNFFESQDIARRNTGKLIFLFVVAVLSLIVVTNLVVMVAIYFAGSDMSSMAATTSFQFDMNLFLGIGAVVGSVVLIASLYKISSLSGGGARIAEMMNARLLVSGNQSPAERRVLNIVEEMAIASGTPVPPVYLLDESGINAFAAGYSPSDAIIAVTKGCIDTLSRDQLQGVIAHEFSHILHGDMRINIRLIGVLHGILVLGIIGRSLLRGRRHGHRNKNSGGTAFIALGLVVVGFVGTFFGNLIKAAVSRQREYLADASAVQFTRNPDGIAQALMQIARHSSHSYLKNPNSAEISHTLFEEGQISPLGRMYATHPPLEDRIRAILPNWDGDYLVSDWDKTSIESEEAKSVGAAASSRDKATAILAGTGSVLLADAIINQAGNPDDRHLQYADSIIHQIPRPQLEAAREPSGARAVVYQLVLSNTESVRVAQLECLCESADTSGYRELQTLLSENKVIDAELRLPLTTIALSSLRQLSQKQYQRFKNNFKELIEIDAKINLLEWALQKIVFHHLDVVFEKNEIPHFGKKNLSACEHSVAVLLSILAHSNSQNGMPREQAFAAGMESLQLSATLINVREINFEVLNEALNELAELKPLQKPALLKACVSCIAADKEFMPIEVELLRAIAAVLDCPVPPLVIS